LPIERNQCRIIVDSVSLLGNAFNRQSAIDNRQ